MFSSFSCAGKQTLSRGKNPEPLPKWCAISHLVDFDLLDKSDVNRYTPSST